MSTNGSRPSVQNCQCRPGPPGSPESSGTIVARRDLLLNDCDGRAAFCNSKRFVRGELGGVFNDMLRVSLGMVVCCGAGCLVRPENRMTTKLVGRHGLMLLAAAHGFQILSRRALGSPSTLSLVKGQGQC